MRVRRTYFVPLCVLAGMLLIPTIATWVIAFMLDAALVKSDEAFEQRYIFSPDRALYAEAVELRRDLSFEKREKVFHMAAGSMTLAGILLWWALDRRRLVFRLNKLEGGATASVACS